MSKRLAAKSMGCGRTFYADEPEDLAYLKQLAKETRGETDVQPGSGHSLRLQDRMVVVRCSLNRE